MSEYASLLAFEALDRRYEAKITSKFEPPVVK